MGTSLTITCMKGGEGEGKGVGVGEITDSCADGGRMPYGVTEAEGSAWGERQAENPRKHCSGTSPGHTSTSPKMWGQAVTNRDLGAEVWGERHSLSLPSSMAVWMARKLEPPPDTN